MAQEESSITRGHSDLPVDACLLQIGAFVVAVYGSEQTGWTVESGDVSPQTPGRFHYRTFDGLFFALVTLTVNSEGRA
jgi:hypothetical protein